MKIRVFNSIDKQLFFLGQECWLYAASPYHTGLSKKKKKSPCHNGNFHLTENQLPYVV